MNRYRSSQEVKTEDGFRYKTNAIYPDIPETADDIYVICTVGDRYDTLAQQFYQDFSLWWIIATANPTSSASSLVPTPGTQLRIPANKAKIISDYENLNKTR